VGAGAMETLVKQIKAAEFVIAAEEIDANESRTSG